MPMILISLDFYDLDLCFILNFRLCRQTLKTVFDDTTRSSSKIARYASYFQLCSRCLETDVVKLRISCLIYYLKDAENITN